MKFNSYIKDQIDFYAKTSTDQLVFSCSDGTSLTYGELKNSITLLASIYRSNNLTSNSPIVVCLPLGLEQALFITSLLYNEIPTLVLPVGTKINEVVRVMRDYPFVGLISTESFIEKIQSSLDEKFFKEKAQIFKTANEQFSLYSMRESSPESLGFNWLLHTSGSTGEPKMVMMSFENLVKRTLGEIELFKIKRGSKILNILPISHDLGLNQLLTTLCSGSSLEIFTKKLPFEFVQRVAQGGFDGITGMPQIWKNFIQIVNHLNIAINHSGYITISGGSMPEENLLQLKKIFQHAKIFKTYGQTETFRTFAESRQDQVVFNQCGSVLSGVEICLLNEENQFCRINEVGQLIHCGDGVMSGYWLDDKLTGMRLKEIEINNQKMMGIFTGDYFKILPGNEYQYVGRKDDMIKHAGRRFFLGEIENCLLKSEWLQDVCVIHRPDEHLASGIGKEKLIAFVIPFDKSLALKKLKEYCVSRLEIFKVPDEFIACENFPQTINKKIDRVALAKSLEG